MNNSGVIIKVVLILLFFICLLDMPYGFYELVRFLSLIGFGILAFHSYEKSNTTTMLIYGVLALLFQPFWKISLGRELWNAVDIMVGIGLIISLFLKPTDYDKRQQVN
jgi:hypothetical protein